MLHSARNAIAPFVQKIELLLIRHFIPSKVGHNFLLSGVHPLGVGKLEAVELATCRACFSSNLAGLLYPSAEWRRLAHYRRLR
jgi:hypothetical protein